MNWMLGRTLRAISLLQLAAALIIASAQSMPANIKSSVSGSGSSSAAALPPRDNVAADYTIGSDDVLAINVWKEPDLSRTVPVRPDGKITLPLVGDIVASGRTPQQLQTSIEQELAKYISKPAVTVIVQEAKSHKFNIVGEVQRPGSYLITTPLTVLDAIAMAGGFRDWAKVKSIY